MRKNTFLIFLFCFIFLSLSQSGLSNEWKRVYLASYPQSGNHWVRYLIEEASHIATSSVYCDPEPPKHMNKVFPWGGYCCDHGYEGHCRYPTKEDFVVIKTHYPYRHKNSHFDRRPYQTVIRIVRHPVDSFYSRYTKLPKGSVQEKIPTARVRELIKSWRKFQIYWNKMPHVITIRYEDILQNPIAELKKMCEALAYDVTDEDIARAAAKYPPEGYMLKHIHKFSTEDLRLISKELRSLMDQFDYDIPL
jgi:hypothetical protein